MGFHMARRLVEAGHHLVVFDARRDALDREARTLGVPMEVAQAVTRMPDLACEELGPDKDLTTVVQTVERHAGVKVSDRIEGFP
jgi:3-hydroxyisobutyrate dehydrogenase-like beta-hydroxyacid dehydrogenase